MRDGLADTNLFLNWTPLYSDCVIGMNLNDWKRTFTDKIKFNVSIGYVHKNLIIDFIFVAAMATIDFEETVINECLTIASESKYINE